MDEKLREIALKYFQTEIIMFPKEWYQRLLKALKEANELKLNN